MMLHTFSRLAGDEFRVRRAGEAAACAVLRAADAHQAARVQAQVDGLRMWDRKEYIIEGPGEAGPVRVIEVHAVLETRQRGASGCALRATPRQGGG